MFKNKLNTLIFGSCLALGFLLSSCKKDEEIVVPVVKPDIAFFALADGTKLLKINAMQSDVAMTSVNITGLMASDALVAIDFRPATGELYGVSSMNRIYVVNQETGVARVVGAAALNPVISGATVSLDFNPTVDRIRLVTNKGQNLRLHPETGAVAATDGVINGSPEAKIESVAYTNNIAGATATVLYDIDSQSDKLFKQDPPNNGTLIEVGMLGVDITSSAGFDINPEGTGALTAVTVAGKSELHQVDLTTGKLTKLGMMPSGNITGLAIPTAPVSYAIDEMNNLVIINFMKIGTPITKAITGLQMGETILGIDFRLTNGQLIGLGSSSRLYAINTASGAATAIGAGPFATLLSGTSFGFDFNPTVDRIRCISNTGQNLRLHPDTGVIAATDGMINPGTPAIMASAYTNNFAGATTTVLFNIDTISDKLNKQDPPNTGTQVEVGALGINVEEAGGFDIGSHSGLAYAALKAGTTSGIYSINLTTGATTKLGDLPAIIRAFTIGIGF